MSAFFADLASKRSKRSRRRKKLKETIEAAVAPDARSDNEASDGPEAPDQAAAAVPAQTHALLQSSMPDASALGQAPATAAAPTLALASSTAPPVADRSETGHLAPVAPSGPPVLSSRRKSKGAHALAHPQSSTEGQQLGSSTQPPSLGGGACAEQHAACDALLDTSLVGVILEAAQAGRELPPKRQRRLALALQKAATAASVLHRALQAAGNILSADLEGRQLGAQRLTPPPARVLPASARAEAAQPGNASGPMLTQAVSGDPGSAARPAPQFAATGKRSRLANESSAAESGDGAGRAKRQKCLELAPPMGSPAVQLANRSIAAASDGAGAAKKQKGPDTASPISSADAPLPSIPAEQTPKPRKLMRSNQQLLGCKFAPCGPGGKPVTQTVQEAALSALKRLRHVGATAEAQAAEAAGCASEAEGAIDAAPTEAPATIDAAMGAPETPGAAPQVDMPADIPGIAFEDSAGQEPATDVSVLPHLSATCPSDSGNNQLHMLAVSLRWSSAMIKAFIMYKNLLTPGRSQTRHLFSCRVREARHHLVLRPALLLRRPSLDMPTSQAVGSLSHPAQLRTQVQCPCSSCARLRGSLGSSRWAWLGS